MHELSHLHLSQRLGFLKRRRIPSWFAEGLANIIAGSGGEGISDNMAILSIKEGRHLILPERRGFLDRMPKTIQEADITGPMYHKQNKMFVNYINSLDPEAFKKLVLAVQRGEAFSESFLTYIETSPEEMWTRFKSELLSTVNKGSGTLSYRSPGAYKQGAGSGYPKNVCPSQSRCYRDRIAPVRPA
jgi:hypothetical protein